MNLKFPDGLVWNRCMADDSDLEHLCSMLENLFSSPHSNCQLTCDEKQAKDLHVHSLLLMTHLNSGRNDQRTQRILYSKLYEFMDNLKLTKKSP